MAFFDKIGESINNGINGMSSMFETNNYSSQLKNIEESLNQYYKELGKLLYETSKGECPDAVYNELFRKIREGNEALDTVNKQIRDAKGTVTCPGCKSELAKGTTFCPNCGTRIPIEVVTVSYVTPGQPVQQAPQMQAPQMQAQPVQQAPQMQAPAMKFCSNCGKQCKSDSVFCDGCGNKMV